MHAKGVKTYAGIRSTCWCVWFQVYKAIKGPVLLTIAGWAGPCWIDLCVCVCQTYKQDQVSTVSREYDVLSMTFLDHCALPFSYYIILMYGVHDMISIVWEPWMMGGFWIWMYDWCRKWWNRMMGSIPAGWGEMSQVPVVYLQLCKALALPCCLADWMSIIQYPNPSSIIQSHRFAAPPNDFFLPINSAV